jgi:hypothetical protein
VLGSACRGGQIAPISGPASSIASSASAAWASAPRADPEQSIRVALDVDGDLGDTLDDFLRRVMTPAADSESR